VFDPTGEGEVNEMLSRAWL